MRRVTYGVLGPLEVMVDGRAARLGGPRKRAVLAVLLLRAGRVVPTPDPAALVAASRDARLVLVRLT
jgi:hypothetical protein